VGVTAGSRAEPGRNTRKTFDRSSTQNSYTCNITHNTESTALWNWSGSGGGHRWFKGSAGGKRLVTRDHNDDNNDNKADSCKAELAEVRVTALSFYCNMDYINMRQ
jgi:hypothetical protein